MKHRYWHLLFLAIVCLTQTGCASVLGQLIALPFQIINTGLQVISKMPLPPPGVF